MSNNGEVDGFDGLVNRLRTLARINVERKIRARQDVDLIVQFRFEMLLLKAQMDTMLLMFGDKGIINKDEYAKRHFDYLKEIVEQLQEALHIKVMNDGSILRLK